jgi:hypothetical protein
MTDAYKATLTALAHSVRNFTEPEFGDPEFFEYAFKTQHIDLTMMFDFWEQQMSDDDIAIIWAQMGCPIFRSHLVEIGQIVLENQTYHEEEE